jgi:hypothetical protein
MTVLETTPNEKLAKAVLPITSEDIDAKLLYRTWKTHEGAKETILNILRGKLDMQIGIALEKQRQYSKARDSFESGKMESFEYDPLKDAYVREATKAIRLNNTIRFYKENKPDKAIETALDMIRQSIDYDVPFSAQNRISNPDNFSK